MAKAFPLTDYIKRAMSYATYAVLEDGSVVGRIPVCPGVLAFAETTKDCRVELRSVLED